MTVHELVEGVLAADRAAVGRALTLVESTRSDHRVQARELLDVLLLHAVESHRVGITGVPGVGKSTFIESLGTKLTGAGHRVAVLAVDPTSKLTGGSILGDKTRMLRLANDPAAFVRPSPSAGTLGGVSRTTRETMVVLEAAGYDVVLVEPVGVGQMAFFELRKSIFWKALMFVIKSSEILQNNLVIFRFFNSAICPLREFDAEDDRVSGTNGP